MDSYRRSKHALGVVLAGGESRRLGQPKPLAPLGGRPLIEWPLEALRLAGLDPVVVAKPDSALPPLGVEIWREARAPIHPLCGIVAALRRGGGRPLVVIAADMPLVAPSVLRWLGERSEPLVIPRAERRLQPLLGRYDPRLLARLEAALERERPLHETVSALDPRIVEEDELAHFADPARLLLNVNTPADLVRAEELLNG